MKNSSIHIENLYKKYKNRDCFAVQDMNLNILDGEFFGILGPNGAGKTTLISMLCGLIKPTSGKFTLLGLNYADNANQIKQNIGVVPQEYSLYPTLTAMENLVYFGSMYGLKGKDLKNKIEFSLERLGLLNFANQRLSTFSGGMKRRINLIIGTLHNPKILFLDEPTVGVDVHSRKEIISFLQKINSEGTTIVYSSHHLLEAQELCTRIAIIDDGKIIEQGSSADLIASLQNATNLEEVFIAITGKNLRDAI